MLSMFWSPGITKDQTIIKFSFSSIMKMSICVSSKSVYGCFLFFNDFNKKPIQGWEGGQILRYLIRTDRSVGPGPLLDGICSIRSDTIHSDHISQKSHISRTIFCKLKFKNHPKICKDTYVVYVLKPWDHQKSNNHKICHSVP